MRENSQEDQISHVAGEFPTSNQKKKNIEYSCFRCITALPALVFSVYCVQKYHT
jgi:hypothetical protein